MPEKLTRRDFLAISGIVTADFLLLLAEKSLSRPPTSVTVAPPVVFWELISSYLEFSAAVAYAKIHPEFRLAAYLGNHFLTGASRPVDVSALYQPP